MKDFTELVAFNEISVLITYTIGCNTYSNSASKILLNILKQMYENTLSNDNNHTLKKNVRNYKVILISSKILPALLRVILRIFVTLSICKT